MTSASPDEIRAGVLTALSRGMSLDYAARADGITVARAEELAREAGWPDDLPRLRREARVARGVPEQGLPVGGLPTRAGPPPPAQGPAGGAVRPAPRRPSGPRPDLSTARTPAILPHPPGHAAARRMVEEIAAEPNAFVACMAPSALAGCQTPRARCSPMTCDGKHPEPGQCCDSCDPGDHCGCCAQFDSTRFADSPEEADAELVAALEVKTPNAWSRELGIVVLDPGGWRSLDDFLPWGVAITRTEFDRRAADSTCKYPTQPQPAEDPMQDEPEIVSTVAEFVPDHPHGLTCGTPGGRCGPDLDAGELTDEELAEEEIELLVDDDPSEAEPLAWDRTELIEEDERLPDATPLADPEPIRALLTHFGVDVEGKTIVVAAPPSKSPPPENPPTKPREVRHFKPGQVPCEVCGVGILKSFVEANGGIQRHPHHAAGS